MELKVDAWPFIVHNSVITLPRFFKLIEFSKLTQPVAGNVVEVGAYKGGSAYLLAACNRDREMFVFDTFSGLPETTSEDKTGETYHHRGDFAADYGYVSGLLSGFSGLKVYRGIFPKETGQYIENRVFSLVHIDVDLYQSVLDCSEFFYPRMAAGGIIVYDDYNHPSCAGAKKALDEFMIDKPEKIEESAECQVFITKR